MLQLHQLFPTVVGTTQLPLDPLQQAACLQALLDGRGEAEGNPSEGCAWTGDLHGVWQLHQDERFQALVQQVNDQVWSYLDSIGFARSQVALHLQRCWPVISDWDQAVGRHHHPNAHLSAVLYLTAPAPVRREFYVCMRPINRMSWWLAWRWVMAVRLHQTIL